MRPGADFHFIAGFDHFRAGRVAESRREWTACLELDGTHDFCEFAISILDARAPRPDAPAPVTESAPDPDAQRTYLEGVIHYQKGDFEKARTSWLQAKELAAEGSNVRTDAIAGLEKLDTILGVKSESKTFEKPGVRIESELPRDLKTAPETKDEHAALQTYFTGLIHYQKGDMERARVEWKRALALAPAGSAVEADAKNGLSKIEKDQPSTRDGRKK